MTTATPVRDRFEAQVMAEPMSGCHLWIGSALPSGYGTFWFNGRRVYAHRFAVEQAGRPIPEGMTVDHLCSTRACVNPAHLEVVTTQENIRRSRGSASKTHCPQGHPYAGDNLYVRPGDGARLCRACRSSVAAKAVS